MNICFRKAVRKDFDRINELFIEMLRAIYKREDVKQYQNGDLDYYFAGKEDWICVAEIDGRIEGFLSVEVHRETENYLYYDDFSVSKAYRGMGIGSALMLEAESYCKTLGFCLARQEKIDAPLTASIIQDYIIFSNQAAVCQPFQHTIGRRLIGIPILISIHRVPPDRLDLQAPVPHFFMFHHGFLPHFLTIHNRVPSVLCNVNPLFS